MTIDEENCVDNDDGMESEKDSADDDDFDSDTSSCDYDSSGMPFWLFLPNNNNFELFSILFPLL